MDLESSDITTFDILDTLHKQMVCLSTSARIQHLFGIHRSPASILADKLFSSFHLDERPILWLLDFLTYRSQEMYVKKHQRLYHIFRMIRHLRV